MRERTPSLGRARRTRPLRSLDVVVYLRDVTPRGTSFRGRSDEAELLEHHEAVEHQDERDVLASGSRTSHQACRASAMARAPRGSATGEAVRRSSVRCSMARLVTAGGRVRSLGLRGSPGVPNPRQTARSQRDRPGRVNQNAPVCRPLMKDVTPPRIPENRGVPGSSPGIAIAGWPAKPRFLQVASPDARSAQTLPWAFSGLFSARRTDKCGCRHARRAS